MRCTSCWRIMQGLLLEVAPGAMYASEPRACICIDVVSLLGKLMLLPGLGTDCLLCHKPLNNKTLPHSDKDSTALRTLVIMKSR